MANPSEIRLCKGLYKPTCTELDPVHVVCQKVVINSTAYAWIDGVDVENPLLLPIECLHDFQNMGSLRQYLQDDRHIELDAEFDNLLDICMRKKNSATVLVRACEIMHTEAIPADEAVSIAYQWGDLLNTLDRAERVAYQQVSH